MNAKSRLLTFLLTDIEGSTRRWEADGDAMRVALETHNHVLRETVEANDGLAAPYIAVGQPERAIEFCHNIMSRSPGPHVLA